MRQMSFAQQAEFQRFSKKSRREHFLEEIDAVMPWAELLALIEPHYPKGETGRPPVGLGIMLRLYFVQHWFALSDPAAEDALYDSAALRRFVGIDLGRAPAPDETTILNFRHLLEQHDLCGQMLDTVNLYLASRGIRITTGTIVDATILHAPSSTKNEKKERDPDMHQTKKGNQWYFGMKAHIGADDQSGLVHTVVSTAANVSDISQAAALLQVNETRIGADAGYVGVQKRPEVKEKMATMPPVVEWHIARRRKPIREMAEGWQKSLILAQEKLKASVRAKVEHAFHVLKNIFRYQKARYKGLRKNDAQL